ncbi:hypothetical protein GGI42DRAFT_268616 [Trichoderma sp. SZMC 28013]
MPEVNFLSILSALTFFLGLVTLEAWRFEWTAFGAVALLDFLIEPCAISFRVFFSFPYFPASAHDLPCCIATNRRSVDSMRGGERQNGGSFFFFFPFAGLDNR